MQSIHCTYGAGLARVAGCAQVHEVGILFAVDSQWRGGSGRGAGRHRAKWLMVGGWIGTTVTNGFVGPVASRVSRGAHREGGWDGQARLDGARAQAAGARLQAAGADGGGARESLLQTRLAARRPSASHPELQIRRRSVGLVRCGCPRFAGTGSWQGSRAGCHGRRSGPSEPRAAVMFLETIGKSC